MIAKRIIVRFKEDPNLWTNLKKDKFLKTLSLNHLSYFKEDFILGAKSSEKVDKIDKIDSLEISQKRLNLNKDLADYYNKAKSEAVLDLPAALNSAFYATIEDNYIKSLFRTFTIECEEVEVEQIFSKLKNRSDVEHYQLNNIYKLHANPNDPKYSDIKQRMEQIKCVQDAWSISEGNNIIVAVIDSGVHYPHIDISNNIWVNTQTGKHGFNIIDPNVEPYDIYGHGTKVTGIITAIKNNSKGIIGVAPKSKVMIIKAASDVDGTLDDNIAISAITRAVTARAKVINISWGFNTIGLSNIHAVEMRRAIQNAFDNNIVVVCSAGNDNADVNTYIPQNLDSFVICVGGTRLVDTSEIKTLSSNWGSKVHVCAPGDGVFTLLSSDNQYGEGNGTSFAAPQVAALAALILAKKPNLSPSRVKTLIINNADNITQEANKSIGNRINVLKTLQAL